MIQNRFKQMYKIDRLDWLKAFNPIIVRFKHRLCSVLMHLLRTFNPTIVRSEQLPGLKITIPVWIFLLHIFPLDWQYFIHNRIINCGTHSFLKILDIRM